MVVFFDAFLVIVTILETNKYIPSVIRTDRITEPQKTRIGLLI
jgi:hypothetical protein